MNVLNDNLIKAEIRSAKASFLNQNGSDLKENIERIKENRNVDKKSDALKFDISIFQDNKRLKFLCFSSFVNDSAQKKIPINLFEYRKFCVRNFAYGFELMDSHQYFKNSGIQIDKTKLESAENNLNEFNSICIKGFTTSAIDNLQSFKNKNIGVEFKRRRSATRNGSAEDIARDFSQVIKNDIPNSRAHNKQVENAEKKVFELSRSNASLNNLGATDFSDLVNKIDESLKSVRLGQ